MTLSPLLDATLNVLAWSVIGDMLGNLTAGLVVGLTFGMLVIIGTVIR